MNERNKSLAIIAAVMVAFIGVVLAWVLLRSGAGPSASSPSAGAESARDDSPAGGSTHDDDADVDAGTRIDPRIANAPRDAIRAELAAPLVLTGHITSADGSPPEREGAVCRLGVSRVQDTDRCRVVLECGRTRMHGAPVLHEASCTFDGEALATLDDEGMSTADHDPSLHFDRAEQTLRIADDRRGIYDAFVVVIRMDSAPQPAGETR